MTLLPGRWQDHVRDLPQVDAIITDPPYGARTHDDAALAKHMMDGAGRETRGRINYSSWDAADVYEFVTSFQDINRGWWFVLTSHDLIPAWDGAYRAVGLYSFAPVPFISKRPRLVGDGPASWTCYGMAARPRSTEFSRWGSLPGAYLPGAKDMDAQVVGAKPEWLMRAIVRDYTRPGDLVLDPCAGGATTLLAAEKEGRRAIGCEVDPETFAKATKRLERPRNVEMF